jgi:hypothetical protein
LARASIATRSGRQARDLARDRGHLNRGNSGAICGGSAHALQMKNAFIMVIYPKITLKNSSLGIFWLLP